MHSDRSSDLRFRRRITWAVVAVGVGSYAVLAITGPDLPTWARWTLFAAVTTAAISADAWEVGVRKLWDADRWPRLLFLVAVAAAGVFWLYWA